MGVHPLMKIVIVGPAYPYRGGIAHHNGLLSRELAKHHDVSLVTFSRQYPRFLFPGTTQMESGEDPLQVSAERLLDSMNPLTWIRTGLALRRKAPAVVIFAYSVPFFGPCYGVVAALARRHGITQIMYLCHNVIPHERRPGDVLFTRFAFAFGDSFLVQSEEVKRDLLRLRPDATVALAPLPVYDVFGASIDRDEARASLGITEPRVLLFFGYIRKYKGLGVLIEAMKTLVRGGMTDLLLLVVGEFYDSEEGYRRQVADAGIERHVRFVSGYLPQDKVVPYFSASDAVVLPYLSATQSAIAQMGYNFDRPLIATAVGGLSEVVVDGKTGYLVPPGDAGALAAAVRRFYDERGMEIMPPHVRQEKRKYSWEFMARTIDELVMTAGKGESKE